MKKIVLLYFLILLTAGMQAQTIISEKWTSGSYPLISAGGATTIVCDADDEDLVQKAAGLLQKDIEMVGGQKPPLTHLPSAKNIVLIGCLEKSALIKKLIAAKNLEVSGLKNKWEAYRIQTVVHPFKGVDKALVIVGSDRRGTAYGVFELSQQLGVSPWYWWADVPVKKKKEVYIIPKNVLSDAPKVKYRGIFINDEAPALSNWSKEKFGGFNHLFYEKVFELMLRLKSNYLWPAMWGNAFYDDDSLNKKTADQYGIVIGTSHHEPLMRAHDEWRRYGSGKWNYDSNAVRLQEFWKTGMQRATNEKIVSIGMRGDGDEPMSRETATALLEKIVADQRKIIADVTKKPADQTPQLWALYKEVQDYYDKGMRVPDDVTLLLCDDNWGNIRKLPKLQDPKRKGGYGIYYHFDFVGGPRNYKWLNTNNLARVWEQMNLAYRYGADRIWIVNVGDIKPMELPISFFLDFAWNPDKWNEDNLRSYYTSWSESQFGKQYAQEIGDVLRKFSQMSARRKPELLDAGTFSLDNYNEGERVLTEWNDLLQTAEKIHSKLPAESKDAFFQVALHPIKAMANLHHLYAAIARNQYYARQNDPKANAYADKAKQHYLADSMLTNQYHQLADGKWNHMMSQTHIGYTYWQQPPVNKMPKVTYVTVSITAKIADALVDTTATGSTLNDNNNTSVFYEYKGIVSMDAEHWAKAVNGKNVRWKVIPDIGRTSSGVTTFPVTQTATLSSGSPHLQYDFYTTSSGKASIHLYFSPTLNFHNTGEGLLFAVSIDNEKPQIISLNKEDKNSISGVWNSWVANNIIVKKSDHQFYKPGKHVLKYWMISPGAVLQKLVVDFGGLKPSYLGPPETKK